MLCLNYVKPRVLEVGTLLFTAIGIGFYVWGIVDIPWDDISKAGKAFFILGGLCLVLVLLIILILMCLRIGNKINESLNSCGKCLVITLMVIEILGFLIIIVSEIIILVNMGDKNDKYLDENGYYRRRRWRSKYSRREWWATICALTAGEVALALDAICTDLLIKVIYAKTNLPYNDYLDEENKKKNNNSVITDKVSEPNYSRSISVFNAPPQQNALTFIGFDKDGHPIYSGNNQYFTQNQNIKQVNNNNNANKK